jgi:hypothetical protein
VYPPAMRGAAKTSMLFGDAKVSLGKLVTEMNA